jgi:lipopolysaccharide-binding protein
MMTVAIAESDTSAAHSRHYRENSFPHISDSGSVDISISFSITSTIDCIVDPVSRAPQLTMKACNFDISSVDVDFHGGASWLYNIFKGLIESAVKDALGKQLCPIVENELGPANAALKKLPMNVTLTHGVVASYALTGNPIVTSDYLVTPHSGSFTPANITAPCPFTPPPVPLNASLPRMMCVAAIQPVLPRSVFSYRSCYSSTDCAQLVLSAPFCSTAAATYG